jgi:hypothetical protein
MTNASGPAALVDDLMRDIDMTVRQIRFISWNEAQEGDRTARKEPRSVLQRYGFPLTRPLFENLMHMSEKTTEGE